MTPHEGHQGCDGNAGRKPFRSDKQTVRYNGHRWRIKRTRPTGWLYLERQTRQGYLYSMWVPRGACT